MECKNKRDTRNNRGNWNPLKIIQEISEQLTGKTRYDIKELNKTATLGTARIVREVLLKCLTSIGGTLRVPYGLSTEQ